MHLVFIFFISLNKCMNILICGDSFAADCSKVTNQIGWPTLLSEHFSVTNIAQAGCSEYRILKQVQKSDFNKYDAIILAHTSPYRLYVENHPCYVDSALHKNSDFIYADVKDKKLEPIVEYFEKYYSIEYALDIHRLLLLEIDSLLQNKKTIHMTGIDYTGINFFKEIYDISNIVKNYPGNCNHLNETGNQIVFCSLYKKLNTLLANS